MDISTDALFLDALFSQGGVGVGVCGVGGRLQEFNSALESMIGPAFPDSPQLEWAAAYHLFDAHGQRPLTSDEIPLVRALAGEVVVDAAITTRRPDQPVRHLRCTAAPLRDGDQAAGALVLVTEVSEHVDDPVAILGAQVARYRLRMSRLHELSARVVAMTNHQIRTPLTVIQSHLELLEDETENLPESARNALPAIRRGVTSLTDALTALTRVNDLANATDPNLEAINLVDVVRRASILIRADHPTQRVHLTAGTEAYLPTNADPAWVRRAIVALNEALIGPGSDTDLALELLDYGDMVGVRLTQLSHNANPPAINGNWTARGDSTTGPRGLGLALAEAVALAHDGSVLIAETPTGMSATLLLSRVPQPPSRHWFTATRASAS